jgi:hypothetical protein
MMAWKRAALAGFAIGVVMALVLLGVTKIAAHGHAKLWIRIVDLSTFLFVTHIFLLPLSDIESFPHDLFFYLAAIIGNGIAYSLAALIITGLYFLTKKFISYFA